MLGIGKLLNLFISNPTQEVSMKQKSLKEIVSLLEDEEKEDEEVSELCEELMDIISSDEDLYSEAVQSFNCDPDIFICICKQFGKLDVLRLMAVTVSTDGYWADNVDTKALTKGKASYWSDFVAAASTKEEFTSTIQVLYGLSVNSDHRMMTEFPNLVEKLKLYWQDEDLMCGAVMLLLRLMEKSKNPEEDKAMLVKSGAISKLAVLFGLLFSTNPDALDIDAEISYPIDPDRDPDESIEPLVSQFVSIVAMVLDKNGDYDTSSKIIRPIIPMVSQAMEQAYDAGVESVAEFFAYGFFMNVATLLGGLMIDGKKNYGGLGTDFVKLVLRFKLIQRLVVIYSDYIHGRECCQKKSCSEKTDVMLSVIKLLLSAIVNVPKADLKSFSDNDRIALLHEMKVCLNNDGIFSNKIIEKHYADLCLLFIREIVMDNPQSRKLKKLFSSPDNGIVSSMIKFAERNPVYMSKVSMNILQTLIAYETVELLQQVISFPPMCIKYLVSSKTIDKSEVIQGKTRDLNNLSVATFKIFHGILCAGTLEQLHEMEQKYQVKDALIKALKVSKKPKMFATIVHHLVEFVHHYDLKFLKPDSLATMMPIIWRKMKISNEVLEESMELTYRVAQLLPKSHTLDFTDLEPFLVEQTAGLLETKPVEAPLLKLCWELVKRPKHKQIYSALSKLSSNKSVGYASPGKTGLAKIFKFLSDLIVEFLENDPQYETDYLRQLTESMVAIARSSSLDEEMYVLEDMVSPAMWFSEKHDDEQIVANVKEFIGILH